MSGDAVSIASDVYKVLGCGFIIELK